MNDYDDIISCDNPEILKDLSDEDILKILAPVLKDHPPIELGVLEHKAAEEYKKGEEKKRHERVKKLKDKIKLGKLGSMRLPKDPMKRKLLTEELKLAAEDIENEKKKES